MKNNIKWTFLASLPKYEQKWIFCKIVLLLQAKKYFAFYSFLKVFNFHEVAGKVRHYWLGGRGGIGHTKWAIPERNQTEGQTEDKFFWEGFFLTGWGHIFLDKLLKLLGFLLYPRKFQTKQSFTLRNSAKLC